MSPEGIEIIRSNSFCSRKIGNQTSIRLENELPLLMVARWDRVLRPQMEADCGVHVASVHFARRDSDANGIKIGAAQ